MPLEQYYQDAVQQQVIRFDPAQSAAVKVLQRIWDELVSIPVVETVPVKKGLFSLFSSPKVEKPATIRGAYIWGGVGRGKTWLMDSFYERIPITQKKRMHYHHFMNYVHDELKKTAHVQNPLLELAKREAPHMRLLCLDEFHVLDIVDAMLLYGLLEAFFQQGITLVTTSNRKPDDLYLNGLQRSRFLPAIALIKRTMDVVELDNNVDYRMLRHVGEHGFIQGHQADEVERELSIEFNALARGKIYTDTTLIIQGRSLPVHKVADNIVWFTFQVLCEGPRSARDYIEIADRYKAVVLSGMPILTETHENAAKRFLNLIDELYDRHVRLILSTAIPLNALYQGEKLVFEYDRAMSRLNEMQSDEYQRRAAA